MSRCHFIFLGMGYICALQLRYRAYDRGFQRHAAEFLQVSCSGLGKTVAVGRESPIFLTFRKYYLADYWRAGSTEKTNKKTKHKSQCCQANQQYHAQSQKGRATARQAEEGGLCSVCPGYGRWV